MSVEVVVSDAAGTRTLDEHNLPLHIGTGQDADIRIPGAVASRDIAQIGMLDGRAFVQVPHQGNVSVNGEAVTSTRWLQEGDSVRVAGVAIACVISNDQLLIRVISEDIDYQTAPPVLQNPTDSPVNSNSDAITPVHARQLLKATNKSTGIRKGLFGIYIALGLLLLAAAYMFTAITVVINSTEGAPQVSLPGSWLTPGWNGRYLLWPGQYEVLLEAPGFFLLQDSIQVVSGERQEYIFELKERPGRLQVTLRPQDAVGEVWIDGLAVGALPIDEIPLERGSYELRIRTQRFLEYIAMVEVEGRDKLQPVVAELIPGWADINVMTEPAGAQVLSEGQSLGVTPAVVELLAGTRELIIHKAGFKTEKRTLSIVAGQQDQLPLIQLQEAGGLIRLNSKPANAAVTLDGQFVGNTPVDLEVAKGSSYQLRLNHKGYVTASHTVDVPDGMPVPVEINLQPKLGKVSIDIQPADASLYIDSKLIDGAVNEFQLLAVPHRLEVRKQGFETWVMQVTPKPGLPQHFDVQLLTPRQAVISAIPKIINTSSGQTLQLIEPGEFMLGAPRREQGRRPNEVRRSVRLTRWFYMGREEVSNKEFREFRPQHTSGAQKYRELAVDSSPAVMVSWQEAVAYCNWLSKREGLEPAYISDGQQLVLAEPATDGYRLPTEAEWVWVARYNAGAKELKYPWGTGMPPPANAGNYADMAAEGVASSTIAGFNDGYPVTSPGGVFSPNQIGIYDLGGNVAEWVTDRYSVAGGTGAILIDPLGPAKGQYHVIRGSSWRHSSISELRLAYRDFGDQGRLDVGFRLARYVTSEIRK
ncbi:MAG: SUMF1/EgtB/PvdO family nonheme iron enzyme [Gammaproteobacteria bacterium]|nr:SUMF1/EgtB/PvdO family nonheme iron enzyme [Gammaproteobacteria bacterium]MCP4929916.1 SUMF1/EgtB/PvdO family nonheme iron enzyme [Gammaproteobacteria bacterium]